MTCWRRLEEWNRAGVWQRLHELLLAELQTAGKLDWSPRRDRLLTCASRPTWPESGPSPVGRARPGSKHHLLTEGAGAALTHPFHNGGTEGVNTKTKLIKRQMYGRAGFALLRHRILLG
jgi:hypothetical protein